ncbi:hypothetical protein RD792_014546 [Penstemon davidsonii]|uniref:t-SNARE coiled-coil homology domain-containing protein n=1 Tax=Penstemon davidsonii TaxID=160366 RepID=A0ABR0CQM1_9LAMI|nr:hypothetical protein RD792_014546 [Penstemon davidsonii]
MDPDILGNTTKAAPRKVRFAPKAPPKREQKPILPKVEKTENDIDVAQAEQLLRKLNESSLKGRPKVEKKVGPTQVAFGFGGSTSSIRSYGGPENGVEKEYTEPWDYYTNYPITLPMRRPYSGNPEILDKKEFEEEPERSTYDESKINSAAELGLTEENVEDKLFFIQLPKIMPTVNQQTNGDVHETGSSAKGAGTPQKPCTLESMPGGPIGKLLVYKSGAIKWKIGDTIYDVSSNLSCGFAQEVVAINTEEKHICSVGELSKRIVVTPDIDSILDSMDRRTALFDGIEEGGIRASASYSSHEIDEQENEKGIDGLQDRVNLLKRLSGDIHEEVESHNLMLDRMENDMDSSRGVLSGTMDKFKMVFETKSSRRMFTLVTSFVVIFLVIYYLTR